MCGCFTQLFTWEEPHHLCNLTNPLAPNLRPLVLPRMPPDELRHVLIALTPARTSPQLRDNEALP
jgi:hypothetical protein